MPVQGFTLSCMKQKRTTPTARLATLIHERRVHLGLNQTDLKDHGGPSPETVIKFEHGKISPAPQPRTLYGFDLALRWAPGSSAAILEGGEPTPLPEVRTHQRNETQLICIPRNIIQDLSMAVAKLALLVTTGAIDVPDELLSGIQAPVQIMAGVMELSDQQGDGGVSSLFSTTR